MKRLHKFEQAFGLDELLKEICVLQDTEHTHIVQFFGIVIQADGLFMLVSHKLIFCKINIKIRLRLGN